MLVLRRPAVIREDFMGDRLRFGIVEVASRDPVEIEPWRYVGAPGEPPFENGWSNVAGQTPLSFCQTPQGIVYLRGVIKNAAQSTATIFTLPVGYAPPPEFTNVWLPSRYQVGTTGDTRQYGTSRLQVNTEAAANPRWVRVQDYTGPAGAVAQLMLNGLMWRIV